MRPSLKIALFYILIGGSWVAFSSFYLGAFMEWLGMENSIILEVIKAVGFVIVSGLIIYLMVERSFEVEKKIRQQYVTIFQNSPISLWVLRQEDLTIVTANKMAKKLFGFDVNRGVRSSFAAFFLPGSDWQVKEVGTKELMRHQRMFGRDGQERVVDVYVVPFTYMGEPCVMAMAVDNTEMERTLAEKDELNHLLKDQNEKLKAFSFINSHHIRKPLSNILGIIGLMNENDIPQRENMKMLKESVENLDNEIRRMNEILSDHNLKTNMSEISEGKKVKSILFVDDDKVQHMINKRILLGVNPDLDLHFYANPVDALEWLKKNKADVMLLDINMPEMNGWEFLDKIRKEGITSDVKMLSSSIDPEDEVRSKQYDMVSGFLIKPLSKEVLIKALKL